MYTQLGVIYTDSLNICWERETPGSGKSEGTMDIGGRTLKGVLTYNILLIKLDGVHTGFIILVFLS